MSVSKIKALKGERPVVMVTAYTASVASIASRHADILLVGDSLGNVIYGMDTTVSVTMEMMIAHGRAVVKHAGYPLVVVDMPFGSFQESKEQAFRNAARIMKETGCHAVKIEGGIEMAETVAFLTSRGIPVMGHVGLLPQSVNALGGFKVQGRGEEGLDQVLRDARAIAEAGAFSVVLECVASHVAEPVTANISVPTIGIGASNACDGQVLVIDDLIGLTENTPKFVKRYAEVGGQIDQAIKAYSDDVIARSFPEHDTHTFS
ncbi:3-methyl-2-oxobutanoate hydroxymethyltransferase [Piscirickettsia litoralis]|uniref:3-methyl-2-oxobutanoate hydroxymethyltransferase n=2 Tax=Piscirickettsia litoralis TaxID=1891921 RepID=A0ABX3A5T6_9GAMM|nr:3-methyl-2-oxobutanoate hydroxymethyltransferase [Piscirickettsia litoralis]